MVMESMITLHYCYVAHGEEEHHGREDMVEQSCSPHGGQEATKEKSPVPISCLWCLVFIINLTESVISWEESEWGIVFIRLA